MASNIRALMTATNFAAIKHRDQRRKDAAATPYINHPIGVAEIISAEAGITDTDILIGALLHDTVEDTDTTFEEIEQHFGTKIRTIVEDCSDDKTLKKEERKLAQIAHAPHACHEAKVVKLADKLYNLRGMDGPGAPADWSDER